MSEQKYYVQINKKLWNNLNPLQLGDVGIDLCPSDQYFIAEYEPESIYAKVNKNSFTKSELAKIMDGALYRPDTSDPVLDHDLDFFDNLEWINPLVKLIPVEEIENV